MGRATADARKQASEPMRVMDAIAVLEFLTGCSSPGGAKCVQVRLQAATLSLLSALSSVLYFWM